MKHYTQISVGNRRRGAAGVMVVIMMTVLLGMAALAVDVGMLYNAKGDLQRAADAAALAAAWELLDADALKGSPDMTDEIGAARSTAASFAAANEILGASPTINSNSGNISTGDLVVGYLSNPADSNAVMDLSNPSLFNSVQVKVRRDDELNGAIPLLFAQILGANESSIMAQATATFEDGVTGYAVTATSGNAGLMPFALKVDVWDDLLNGISNFGDTYAYDDNAAIVASGSDGILEVNLYPGAGIYQLPPGNFGTVDIGSNSNSTADLSRQILHGINADDLAYHGGTLELDSYGELPLNGDTGLSAGIKDELAAIIGQPRSLPLFSTVAGNGNNATYTIVGFVGIRVLNVRLTGPMSSKEVIIQPAFAVDGTVITGGGTNLSKFVYKPVYLTR